jgi:DNA polymerase/3'-5' exonuclease PolX
MKLYEARRVAEDVVRRLKPHCEQIEIAGSIRRGKADVGDIEIVAAPLMSYQNDLLGDPVPVNPLEHYPWSSLGECIKCGPRYKQIRIPTDATITGTSWINLDLFIVLPPAQWGVIYTIRTGPVEFSHWCVTQRKKRGGLPSDCTVRDGGVYRGDQLIPMADELDFLDFLGLGWVNPSERKARW